MLGADPDRPLLPPLQLFVPAEEFYTRAKAFARIDLLDSAEADPEQPLISAALPSLAVDRRAPEPVAALKSFLASAGLRVLLSAESPGRRETMISYLQDHGLSPSPTENFETF